MTDDELSDTLDAWALDAMRGRSLLGADQDLRQAVARIRALIVERDDAAYWEGEQRDRAEKAEAEVARLRAAVAAFLSYADQRPQRAASGAGGQTMDNVTRGTLVSVSLWEIEALRGALSTEDTP